MKGTNILKIQIKKKEYVGGDRKLSTDSRKL